MKNERTKWLCIFGLGLAAGLSTSGTALGQTAAEYRTRAEPVKQWPREAVRGATAMVATDEQLGSKAGVEILKRGGNAVDAAVAVAFALAVVEPAAGNIGGGGFMLVRLANGPTTFLDYREVAPGKATRDMYIKPDGKLDEQASVIGYKSVAVPGTVAGLELVLKTYGTMKLADVMAPAIRLAEVGFAVSAKLAQELDEERAALEPFAMSRRIFLNDGKMLSAGDTLKQPELAATLKRIAKKGAEEFYGGETARMIVADMAKSGGLVTMEDLAGYKPRVREVLRAKYESGGHDWEVVTSPPPSSGGVAIIEALNMLKDVPLKSWDDVESVHMVAETMRRVFADRAAYLADPDYSNVPVAGLTDPCYAKELAETIDAQRASSSKEVRAGKPHTCGVAGAGAVTYLLNDEMDDFTTQPGVPNALFGLIQSEANAIAPGHRPLSSMTPTILLRDGKLSFV